jgi:hypothetical protein
MTFNSIQFSMINLALAAKLPMVDFKPAGNKAVKPAYSINGQFSFPWYPSALGALCNPPPAAGLRG